MRNDGKAENQHFVAKMLLRPFASGKGDGQVRVFDKHTNRTITSPVAIKKNLWAATIQRSKNARRGKRLIGRAPYETRGRHYPYPPAHAQ